MVTVDTLSHAQAIAHKIQVALETGIHTGKNPLTDAPNKYSILHLTPEWLRLNSVESDPEAFYQIARSAPVHFVGIVDLTKEPRDGLFDGGYRLIILTQLPSGHFIHNSDYNYLYL